MQLACNRSGNNLDLRRTGIKWIDTKGWRKSIRVAITKTKDTHTYPIDKLKLHAKDWEPEKATKNRMQTSCNTKEIEVLEKFIMSLPSTINVGNSLIGKEISDRDVNEDGGG